MNYDTLPIKSHALYLRQRRREFPKIKRAQNLRWQAANRGKYLAHKAVENAIRAGKLTRQPCQRCGALRLVHAHHDDYSKPLDVMWLCPLHHAERHKELAASTSSAGGG